jgi:hypothetical protein
MNGTSRAKSSRQVNRFHVNGRSPRQVLAHLEAENAELRDRAVDLVLEIQSLREGRIPTVLQTPA